jgi:hypothetical protein
MKSKLIALSLFIVTAVAVVMSPAYQGIAALTTPSVSLPPVDPLTNTRPRIDVVFVLDTTGSMGGLIQAAKEKIWSIATTMASAQPAPVIRMGLVAYRDRGDAYVTRVVDLSDDLDSLYATLMDFQAAGGGDGPESVNQALHTAASLESRARRAAFNVSGSGAVNFLGEGELVDDVASGRVELSRIDRDKLPEPMQAMAPAAQQALITETAERRKELKRQISELAGQRADYLKKKLEDSGSGRDSLDDKIYKVVRDQAGKVGLHYEAAAPAY